MMMWGLQPMFMILMMMFGGVGGNEALDYVDTKEYWRQQGGALGEEELILEVKKPAEKEGAGAKAKEVRRLMAIRTLGEMKSEKGLVVLKEMLGSEEMFVGEYAREAIGVIEGKKVEYAAGEDFLDKDLAMLPKETGVVGRLKLSSGPSVDVRGMLKQMQEAFGGEEGLNQSDVMVQMQTGLLKVIEETGNVRVDSLMIGVAENVGDEKGWVMGSLRGEYDREAMAAAIKKLSGQGLDDEKVGGAMMMSFGDGFRLGMVSDGHVFFIGGAKEVKLPLGEIVAGMESGELQVGEGLEKLIGRTEKKGPLWVSAMVTGKMKEEKLLESLTTLQFESERRGGFLEMLLMGIGEDGMKVQQTLGKLEGMYKEFVIPRMPDVRKAFGEEGKDLAVAIESVEFRGKGKRAFVQMKVKESDPVTLFGAMMRATMMGVQMDIDEFDEELDFEEEGFEIEGE